MTLRPVLCRPHKANRESQNEDSDFGVSWSETFKDLESGIRFVRIVVLEKLQVPANDSNTRQIYSERIRNRDRSWVLNKTRVNLEVCSSGCAPFCACVMF